MLPIYEYIFSHIKIYHFPLFAFIRTCLIVLSCVLINLDFCLFIYSYITSLHTFGLSLYIKILPVVYVLLNLGELFSSSKFFSLSTFKSPMASSIFFQKQLFLTILLLLCSQLPMCLSLWIFPATVVFICPLSCQSICTKVIFLCSTLCCCSVYSFI